MIEIKNLSISTAKYDVLSDLSLDIKQGEQVSIIGDSGSGKSTLGLAILGYVASGLTLKNGNIKINDKIIMDKGHIVSHKELNKIRKTIGRLDQDPAASLTPTHKIKSLLTEFTPKNHRYSELMSIKQALKTFALPDDTEFLNRYPNEISGGQRRRVALARILLRRPQLLILDEPTSGLDLKTRNLVIEQIKTLQSKLHCALLLITHDYDVAKMLCTKHLQLVDGKLHKSNITVKSEERRCGETLYCPCSSTTIHKNKNSPVLTIKNLIASPPALKDPPIKNLSFEIHSGEALALTGNSGSGKSTVAKTLLGLWPKRAGEMYLNDMELPSLLENRNPGLRTQLGWVPQDPLTSFNPVVELGICMKRAKSRQEKYCPLGKCGCSKSPYSLKEIIKMVGLDEINWEKRLPSELSGGQIQRLAIARAIVGGAQILILDEVTTSLDPAMRDEICKILENIKKHIPMLVITHEKKVVDRLCDRKIAL